jgi:hypothetical protein
VVTNSFDAGRAAAGALDPAALEPGPYIIRVTARDISGNEATEGRDLSIIVARSAN